MSKSSGSPPNRRHDLDNLRTFLTALVIYHHTALVYGGPGSWLFKSLYVSQGSLALIPFNAVNQSFFMGLFFWLSGLLSGNSLSKSPTVHSRLSFLRSKMFHLGIPAIVYTAFVHPLSSLIGTVGLGPNLTASTLTSALLTYWKQSRGVRGPVWYLMTLLSFDMLVALGIPPKNQKVVQKSLDFISNRLSIVSLWFSSTAMTFFLRLYYPVGTTIPILGVQPAYLPQYILSYTLGLVSSVTDTPTLLTPFDSEKVKDKSKSDTQTSDLDGQSLDTNSPLHPAIPLFLSFLSFPLILSHHVFASYINKSTQRPGTLSIIGGGFTLPAFLYTLWGEISYSFIGPSLLQYFARFHNRQTRKGSIFYPRYSYAAFLVHTPISVVLGIAVDRVLGTMMKNGGTQGRFGRTLMPVILTAVVGTGNVLGSFALGKFLVEYVPGLKRVL